jgi:MFS family permease
MRVRPLTQLPRNVWAVSVTSFLMDISSEMVLNLLPLFLAGVLGVRTTMIGVIEGVAESASSLLRWPSGWLSDRLGTRKWPAVAGYGISALVKPLFYVASSWGIVAAARWGDRVGKAVRTAPRDALVADSIAPDRRGLAFGLHRAADSAGAMLGILGAIAAVWLVQGAAADLQARTFRIVVLVSLAPAVLSVVALALGAREVRAARRESNGGQAPSLRLARLGRPFAAFLGIVAVFELGNSADAFVVLRARSLGESVLAILGMLAVFNLVYALVSMPAGSLSDRISRKRVIVAGWASYALMYLGFAATAGGWQMWVLYAAYGAYYGAAYGTARALIADIVPAELRGTAYGVYSAVVGALNLPSSIIAGVLWDALGPRAPFIAGAVLAALAALLLAAWRPRSALGPGTDPSRAS